MTAYTIPAGARVLAEDLKLITDQTTAQQGTGWTDWSATFALGAVTTAPTKGNSTYSVAYRYPAGGDVVDLRGYILIGSTFAAGNGVYRFPVPVNASAGAILGEVGPAHIFDTGTAERTAIVKFGAAGYLEMVLNGAASAITNAGSGTAWATGDVLRWRIRYEPA